jgi:hypothetical protein
MPATCTAVFKNTPLHVSGKLSHRTSAKRPANRNTPRIPQPGPFIVSFDIEHPKNVEARPA